MKNPSNEEKAHTAMQAAKNWQIHVISKIGVLCVSKKNSDMNNIACLLMEILKFLPSFLYDSYNIKSGGLDMPYKIPEPKVIT